MDGWIEWCTPCNHNVELTSTQGSESISTQLTTLCSHLFVYYSATEYLTVRCVICCRNGYETSCRSDCSCEREWFQPVCGVDGLTYFSPCYAGCQNSVGFTVSYLGLLGLLLYQATNEWSKVSRVLFCSCFVHVTKRKYLCNLYKNLKSNFWKTKETIRPGEILGLECH